MFRCYHFVFTVRPKKLNSNKSSSVLLLKHTFSTENKQKGPFPNPLKNAYVISEWAKSYAYGELWKVIEFEKMLANISVPEVERIDTSAIYHKTTIKGTHK